MEWFMWKRRRSSRCMIKCAKWNRDWNWLEGMLGLDVLLYRMRVVFILLCSVQIVLGAAVGRTNYFELMPAEYQKIAGRKLVFERVDQQLLAAAILHECNRQRTERKLPALKHDAKATEAAKIQSEIMRKRGSISHVNPESAQYRTLEQRVKAVGLKPRMFAENVATAFGL